MEEAAKHLSPVWYRYTHIMAERAEGTYVYAADGRRYLDFTSGIGVTNTGHCHPRVVEAVQAQAEKLIHGQANIIYHQPMLRVAKELSGVVPEGLDGLFFSNSGAEAVEAAIKLARQTTGRTNVIVFQGSFHGRTVGTMSLTTSKTIFRAGYQPLMPGVFVAPYPYAYRYGWEDEACAQWCLQELEHLLVTQTAPEETAAILVEPVLGEGGYVVPPRSFLPGLRRLCDKYDILLVADEVQSGFGRTGRFFAVEHWDVVPDILVMAKGLASGFPLSGIAAPLALMEKWIPGSHGGTYGGNAVACAAAAATIRVLLEEGLVENASRQGELLLDHLRSLQQRYDLIGDVRGLGLMVACEFTAADGQPDKASAKAIMASCLEDGLLLLTCGPYDNTVRWIPPLIVTAEQIRDGLDIFEKALQSL
ncbi:MAG: aminotransferase class III-fold pyridoxal phosphate-dependent enzyme [Anaerolineae bacterium]|nr:aminotransferase class III-fold pyridoxal phosphate-dependent enzyme [Anaerolineae bacterium]NIN94771.1 aminotransferase class III-fold pyridoxal phosphate-dependent enzyme [Anaerolineae bacterium]NIQ77853.1 aminotransferase class III-fold pyridoxal phosphate-dependent enzyme [Anaerolineae bacterium]